MNRLFNLSKEKLIEILEKFYVNLVKEPKYNIYSKVFFIEYLKHTLEIYKRYKNLKVNLVLFKFDANQISLIKKLLRKSDLIAKYDNTFVIMLFQTGKMGTYKVKNKLEKHLNKKGILIEVTINNSAEDIIKKIEKNIKLFN
ncbi:hypothetical protein JCM11957_08180 [Caminibacter profundus]